jgi:hypothetical protein
MKIPTEADSLEHVLYGYARQLYSTHAREKASLPLYVKEYVSPAQLILRTPTNV